MRLPKLLILIIFSLLSFIFFSPKVHAAAPASLVIFTSFKPWLSASSTPVDMGGYINTVEKTTTNNIFIPIAQYPYNGKMLETNGGNVRPDSNSVMWGTSGDFYDAAYTVRNQLIWCGNSVGVPNGQFEADVSVNFQNGSFVDDNSLVINGVKRKGHWEGYWYRDLGNGRKTPNDAFKGKVARVAAFNPYTTVVSFTFVEDAPINAIIVNKYSPSSHPANSSFADVNPAISRSNIDLYYKGTNNTWTKFDSGNRDNPALYPSIFTFLTYYIDVEVPPDWTLKKATLNNATVSVEDCRQVGSSKYCKVGLPGFGVKLGFSLADIFVINLWFDPNSVSPGSLICKYLDKEGDYYWTGWGIDMSNQADKPQIKVYEGDRVIETLYGNTGGAETSDIRSNNKDFPNASDYTNYNIKTLLGDSFHSNQNRNLVYKLVTKSGEIFIGQQRVGPGTDCATTPYYYPWLQTKQGNVVANGSIEGQQDAPKLLGSIRYGGANNKEADFLVISKIGGGNPFCSLYNYILTNESSKTNCSNGAGYTVLNSPPLNIDGKDLVVQSTLKAYDDLKISECAQDKSSQDMSNITFAINSKCSSGMVYKLTSGNTLGSIKVNSGRVTILYDGDQDLILASDINYGGDRARLSQLPSLAIVSKSNIRIAPAVKDINAVLYSAGKIDTCSDPNSAKCNIQLIVNGMLVGKSGFKFGRTYYDLVPKPAELVTFSPVSTILVPPGIDSLYYRKVTTTPYKLDTSEYSPRF